MRNHTTALRTALALAVLSVATLTGCSAVSANDTAPTTQEAVLPVQTNPITNASMLPGLTLVGAAVEDNLDSRTGEAISDRLQVQVRNDTAQELKNFEVFYTMTDVITGAVESYYQDLTDFSLAPDAAFSIEFDGESAPGHFPENPFSLYRLSPNQVDFVVEVSAHGVQPVTATATKGSGVGDLAD